MKNFIIGLGLITIAAMHHGIAHADPIDDAASTALHNVEAQSKQTQNEFGGAIYELDGKLIATEPETGNGREVTLHIRIPAHAHLVALYHTHPGLEVASEDFSEMDINVAKQLKVPSYILATRSGTIHRFTYGVDHIIPVQAHDSRGNDEDVKSSAGTILASNN